MKTCIAIPIYNEIPTEAEIISLTRNISVLKDYPIFAVCPETMNLAAYDSFGFTKIIPFSNNYFVSNKSYSRLILSMEFYEPFKDFDYMLIAQTDTYILNTNYTLEYFVNKGYDYYGAPWIDGPFDEPYGLREYFKSLFVHNPKILHVGNGGFSLRNVRKCEDLVKRHRLYIKYFWKLNEDLFFSVKMKNKPSAKEASEFALETNMQEEIDKGNYPYALHAFKKYLNCDVRDINPFS